MPEIVFAQASCSSRDPATGMIVRLVANEPWHASDPFVKAMPHLFTTDPGHIKGTVAAPPKPKAGKRGVEQATAAPGEARATF